MKGKYSFKRLTAASLVMASLLSVCPVTFATDNVVFSEDFSASALPEWISSDVGTVTDGSFVMAADTVNYVADNTYERIAISADATVYTSTKDSGFPTGTTAYVVARGSGEGNTGYDFGIGVHTSGQTYVRLYRRDVNGVSKMLYQSTEPVEGIGAIKAGVSYNIKLITTENLVLGYINDVLVASVQDDAFTSGCVGLRTLDGEAKFDNVKVVEVPERKVEGITITEHDTEVSLVGKISFKGQILYNSVYGTEEFDQDTEGVTFSGLDGRTGEKTLTVSYVEKTAQFNIQVKEKFSPAVIYQDDFSDADVSWQGGTYTSQGIQYNFTIANGVASVTAPQMAGLNIPLSVSLTRPTAEMENYDYYCVKATAYITGDSVSTSRKGMAAIQFAKDPLTGSAYELRLGSDGKIYVYCGSTLLTTALLQDVTGEKFVYGKAYTLRAYVFDDVAILSVNNKTICYFNDLAGSVGHGAIRAIAGSVKFDDYLCVEAEQKGNYALSSIAVYSLETGKAVGSNALYYFNTEDYVLLGKYLDGTSMPIHLNKAAISYYDPTSSALQRITVSYGGKSCTINYAYKPYLFYDGFEDGYSSRWSLSTNDNLTYEVQSGRMAFAYNALAGANASVQGQVMDGTQWTNYAVSADIFFNPKSGTLSRYFGLVGRRTGNSWYEFRLIYSTAGQMTGVLARFDQGTYVILSKITSAQLNACLESGETLGTGSLYNMKMSLTGNVIKLYFNNKLMLTYEDKSENALFEGTAGYRVISNSCMLDNFTVEKRGSSKIKSFALSQFPEGDVTVWQGNGIEIWNNQLVVNYADGLVEEVMLKAEMLGDFANTELGVHAVDVTYEGQTLPIYVTVKERPEYIQQISDLIDDFGTKVGDSNVEAFMELKAHYDALSPYEAAAISTELTQKYRELLHSYDVYIAPELTGATLQTNDTLHTDVLEIWGDSIEGSGGKWLQTNSVLYHAQVAYGQSTTGWKCPDVYGNITGISADLKLFQDVMYAGVGINVGNDGYYHARVANTSVDENKEPVYELQFLRKTSDGHTKIESINLAGYDIMLEHNTWFNLLMTVENNIICVYFDGQMMIRFEETEQQFTVGEAGVRISQGDALVDNIRLYGTLRDRDPDSSELVEPTTYTDDFEDETVSADPSHWVENYTQSVITDNWHIYDIDTKVYGTKSNGYTETYLYGFDHDPTITARFMVSEQAKDGQFGFITRMAPSTAFTFVGYDAAMEKWYVKSQATEAEGPQITYQEGSFQLTLNQWYNAELILKGEAVSLSIDGVEVLEYSNLRHTGYGRMGFYTQDTSVFFDDYTVIMASGDIPQEGVISYVINEDEQSNMFEIETFDDGENLLGLSIKSVMISDDAGLTWENVTGNSVYSQLKPQNYTTVLHMSNGKYMQVLQNDELKVQVSDDLLNWTTISNLVPLEVQKNGNGTKVAIFHVNSATEVTLSNGQKRIFMPVTYRKFANNNAIIGHYTQVCYSDDFGYTWQSSETTTKELLPGYTETNNMTWAESKIIACADGSLRMYYSRNRLGCMQYTVSYDDGVTWEGLYQIPEIQQPMTSYAIMEDPTQEGTFYMVCCIGKYRHLGAIHPRTQFALLRSTDGMNWEFLMNLERMTDYISVQNGVSVYQILDPSLLITEDYVYVTMGRSEREYAENDANAHQAQRVYYVRIEKDKLQSRPWDASTIADMYYPKSIEFEQAPQTVFGLADLFACDGTLKLTDFLGNETFVSIADNCTVFEEPDMFNLGESTVHLRYKNGTDLSYTVTIRDYYDISWDIYGEGTIEPMEERIYAGDQGTYRILPAEGWKISAVFVNEQTVTLNGDVLVLENLTQDAEVIVVFKEKTLLDQPWFLILPAGGVLILCGLITVWVLGKKRKKKANSEPAEGSQEE